MWDGAAAEEAAVVAGESLVGMAEEAAVDAGESLAGILSLAGMAGEAAVDAGELLTGMTEETGLLVAAGGSAATEELAGRDADVAISPPPPLRRLEPDSESESPAAELVAIGFDEGASLALYPDPEDVGSGPETTVADPSGSV